MAKLVCGVGYNDADYTISKTVNGKRVTCPFYRVWVNMLTRCYSEKEHERYPKYKGCSVCAEWLTFSRFRAWMENQKWRGNHLDKDIIKAGNKVYCPEFCAFVEPVVNSFILDNQAIRGKYKIGVSFNLANKKFQAHCKNPHNNKTTYLGYFLDENDAHLAWKAKKHEFALSLSGRINDDRVMLALITMYQ